MQILLGSLVRDTVSGFEGRVRSRIEFMNGCVRYEVQPPVKKGNILPESKSIDEQNLSVVARPKEGFALAERNPKFRFGVKAKDRLTGLEGIVVVRMTYLKSGERYGIQPKVDSNGQMPDVQVFDEEDLVQIDPPLPKGKKEGEEEKKHPNGPHGYTNKLSR